VNLIWETGEDVYDIYGNVIPSLTKQFKTYPNMLIEVTLAEVEKGTDFVIFKITGNSIS